MKKLSAIIAAAIVVAMSSVSAFAAGINTAEQDVLDKLKASEQFNAGFITNTAELTNQAENYFNTIDMTDAQSKEIISIIEDGEEYFKSTGSTTVYDMTFEEKNELFAYGQKACAVVDVTISYTKANRTLTAYDKDGKVIASTQVSVDKETGSVSSDTIKTTGSGVNTAAVAGAAFGVVALMAGAAVYTVRTKKERA